MDESTTAVRIAFVCVQNAGRSQMATAFGRREVESRTLEDAVTILTGGTRPAEHVHEEVIQAMNEVGVDLADQTPREISFAEIRDSDYVITMGCSAEDVCPAGWAGTHREWDLEDPEGKDPERVRAIRESVRQHVIALFDEIEET